MRFIGNYQGSRVFECSDWEYLNRDKAADLCNIVYIVNSQAIKNGKVFGSYNGHILELFDYTYPYAPDHRVILEERKREAKEERERAYGGLSYLMTDEETVRETCKKEEEDNPLTEKEIDFKALLAEINLDDFRIKFENYV